MNYWEERYARQGMRTVGHCGLSEDAITVSAAKIYAKYGSLFRDKFSGRTVLDFGCGWGRLSKVLSECGAVVTGIDVVAWAVEQACKYVPLGKFVEFDGKWIPFPNEFFDGVFTWTVLQHVHPERIFGVMDEIYRVMTPGSNLVMYENVSKKPDNQMYIWFRSAEWYIDLAESIGFTVVSRECVDWIDGMGERHELMIFRRRN